MAAVGDKTLGVTGREIGVLPTGTKSGFGAAVVSSLGRHGALVMLPDAAGDKTLRTRFNYNSSGFPPAEATPAEPPTPPVQGFGPSVG